MKIILMKSANDNKSYRIFEKLGIDTCRLEDLEKTDEKLTEFVKEKYTTIIMTNEVAGFSENIIKKYKKSENVNIYITPDKKY